MVVSSVKLEPAIEPQPVDDPIPVSGAAVPHPVPALPIPPPPPGRYSIGSTGSPTTMGASTDVVLHRLHRQQEQYDQMWDAKYQELVAYHSKHGTANVPQSEGVLGRWVGRQREAKKKGLPEDRVQLLVSFEGGGLVPQFYSFRSTLSLRRSDLG